MKKKQDNISAKLESERCMDEWRRAQGIVIAEPGGTPVGNYPLEFLDQATFSLARTHSPQILLTAARAHALGLGHSDIRVDASGLSLPQIRFLADPTAESTSLAELNITPASEIDRLALRLAKQASLLPALLLMHRDLPDDWLVLDANVLRLSFEHPEHGVSIASQALLPIAGAEDSRIVCFRVQHSTSIHLALIIGQPDLQDSPLARIHSSCVTGDILGSLRCDCGDQLHLAIEQIQSSGGGVLLYLHQEGRGIGIVNKLRAYQLQQQGMDTYAANYALGYEGDERDFSIAAEMLRLLGISRIRMLTNNPHKMTALEKAGIVVSERVPLRAPANPHNTSYLEAKVKKSGHLM